MPAFFTVKDFKQEINKDPNNVQEVMEKRIVEQFKNKDIDINTYKQSIRRLDFIFDVLSVRKNIFGEEKLDGNFKYLGAFGRIN